MPAINLIFIFDGECFFANLSLPKRLLSRK